MQPLTTSASRACLRVTRCIAGCGVAIAVSTPSTAAIAASNDLAKQLVQYRYVAVATVTENQPVAGEPARLGLRLGRVVLGLVSDTLFTLVGPHATYFARPGLLAGVQVLAFSRFGTRGASGAPGDVLLIAPDGGLHTGIADARAVLAIGDLPIGSPQSYQRLESQLAAQAEHHPARWIQSGRGLREVRIERVEGPPWRLEVSDAGHILGERGGPGRRWLLLNPTARCPYTPHVGDTLVVPVRGVAGSVSDTIRTCLEDVVLRAGRFPLLEVPAVMMGTQFIARNGRVELVRGRTR